MQYSFVSAAFLALLASVSAIDGPTAGFDVLTSPTPNQNVAAGSSLDIIWAPGNWTEGTATIQLLQGGKPETLVPGQVIKAGVPNNDGKYTWEVPTTLESFATYGFTITLDGSKDPVIFQYSFPFHITGLSNGTASTTTSGGSGGTTTVHLGTGTAYTPEPTTTTHANTTTYYPTTSKNVTISYATPKPSSNVTLSTILTVTPTTTSASSASPTSSTPAEQTANAAIANAASGSLALIGGLVLAFVL